MEQKPVASSKVFFPNLDGLRFVCFFLVFLWHANETIFRRISNKQTVGILDFLFGNGNVGVNIFFVLSGFLITFLLIREKEIKSDINLKNFYVRRILRIWPLYYLVVIIGFCFFPLLKGSIQAAQFDFSNIGYYLVFAANYHLPEVWNQIPDTIALAVLWSVAVEEQFYLVWPVLMKWVPTRKSLYLFGAIIAGTFVFRAFYSSPFHTRYEHDFVMRNFHAFAVIGDMALGGAVAYLCSYPSRFLHFLQRVPKWQIFAWYLLTIGVVLFRDTLFQHPAAMPFEKPVLALLFALIIAEQNFAEHSFFKFSRFKWISKMGNYTYGLYCLHFMAILLVQKAFEKKGVETDTLGKASLAAGLAFGISIVVALMSYHFFEKHFLKWKEKFAVITKK